MLERFTIEAQQVLVQAQREARLLDHGFIGCEHLLLGLAGAEGTAASTALAAFGLGIDALRRRTADLVGAGDQALDAEALASLGIDLATVRDTVEATFGRGALDARRNRRCRTGRGGHIPFTPRAKKALEVSVRIAAGRGDREVAAGHLLLGVTGQHNNVALQVLRDAGVRADSLRQEVTRRMASAA